MTEKKEEKLKGLVSLLPSQPGVYRFFNSEGKVIYVGKAKNLKKRVSSYFLSRSGADRKLQVLVRNIADIKHIVVENEADALFLENNLIKELKPRYNILLKDDKTYPWIAIRGEHFPRVVSTRRLDRDGSRYFGPYSSGYFQKQMLEMIRGIYNVRSCSLNLSPENIRKGKYSVCLEYHIGNCKGPCAGLQTEEDYNAEISQIAQILKGNVRDVAEHLDVQMKTAASQMKFEQAQRYKEQMEMVGNFSNKTVIVSSTITDLDVFYLLIADEGVAFCNFMRVKSGAVINSFTVEMKLALRETPQEVMTFAIAQIADKIEGGLSREIVVSVMPDAAAFPGKKFRVPHQGDKLKLLELAEKNCRLYRIEKLKYIEKVDPMRHSDRIMSQMQRDLHLSVQPRHIECFDNSNIQGTNPVASCVVFRDGKPSKSEYRHFNIKTVVGANDFASMEEVIFRRYSRILDEGGDLPDLIVVDGGKGQLSSAYGVLKKLGLEDKIAIIGLAKRLEEVFFPGDPTPYYLDKTSETLKILMHIRDEAHRFGLAFHRQKRSLNFIKSELLQIEGLGKVSAEKLLKRFKTVSAIKSAAQQELAGVVGAKRAAVIKEYFK